MSMDLSVKCSHCGADIGEICKESCSVNGEKIKKVNMLLKELGLKNCLKHVVENITA